MNIVLLQCFFFVLVAGRMYDLTIDREKNDLNLTCDAINASKTMCDFWINTTERIIDIVHGISSEDAAYVISNNTVSFKLQPKYEGTFYCGEINGNESAGIGPIAGNTHESMH